MLKQFIQYIKDSRLELKLVNWPMRKQVIQYTVVIVMISVSVALFLGGLDIVLGRVLNRFVF